MINKIIFFATLSLVSVILFQNCSPTNFNSRQESEDFNSELGVQDQLNIRAQIFSFKNKTIPVSIFNTIARTARSRVSPCWRSTSSCISGLADTSTYVRQNGDILITGSNDLAIHDIIIFKINNKILSVAREIRASDIGFCPGTMGAAEIAIYDQKEILLFQGVKSTSGCPNNGDIATLNAKLSIYYISFDKQGLEDSSHRIVAESISNFFGETGTGGNLIPQIDPSLYCERDDCYFSYVYFENGNKIAIRKFSIGSPQGFETRKVEGLVRRESITEAPSIEKIGNRYYLFYSTGRVDGKYGLNYRFADSIEHLISPPHNSGLFGDGVILSSEFYPNGQRSYNQGHGDIYKMNNGIYLGHHQLQFNNDIQAGQRFSQFKKLHINTNGFITPYSDSNFLHSAAAVALSISPILETGIKYKFNYINPAFQYSFDLYLNDNTIVGPCINAGQVGNFSTFADHQYSNNGKIYFNCIGQPENGPKRLVDSALVKKAVLVRLPVGSTNWFGSEAKEFNLVRSGSQSVSINFDFL